MNVVDLQGMADPEKDRYVLTDPAIHHESLSKFFNSGSNFGAAWMTTSSSMSSHIVHKYSVRLHDVIHASTTTHRPPSSFNNSFASSRVHRH